MTLFNKAKLAKKMGAVGKFVGAQTKLTNYEYGRKHAKAISKGPAVKRELNKKNREIVNEAKRLTHERN
jgi:hypothetical protein